MSEEVRRCRHADRIGEHKNVQSRPTFEGGEQPLCDPCWDDYQDMIYRMWESHH